LKVECDDWYGRNLDAEQKDDCLKCIKDEKRLALVEEELEEQSKKLAEQSKELAETNKKLIELKQEQSNLIKGYIRSSMIR
jgi:septal ring factor EnvC (AmiA/AmiB activator)